MAIRGLDAWLTREGPSYSVDPHVPWEPWDGVVPGTFEVVLGDPEEYPPALVVVEERAAKAWVEWLNLCWRYVAREDPDWSQGGRCRVCGDWHNEPDYDPAQVGL